MRTVAKINTFLLFILFLAFTFISCEKELEPEIFDQIAPANFFKTAEDVNSAVIGIYAEFGNQAGNNNSPIFMGEWGTDEYRNNSGSSESVNAFDWRENTNAEMYYSLVPAVTKAGDVIEVVKKLDFLKETEKAQYLAELRTARAIFMFDLLRFYGPCAVITDEQNLINPDNNFKPARPALDSPEGKKFNEDYQLFIENDLIEAIDGLPVKAAEYGRFDKGIALTVMLKFYMYQKNFAKAEAISMQIIDLKKYKLEADYASIWTIANEENKEIIWAIPRTSNTLGQTFRARTLHSGYDVSTETKWNMDKIRFDFFDTFDKANDKRSNLIVDKFTNKAGKAVDMRDESVNYYGAFCFKYSADPDAKERSGVDIVMMRYADVLLLRAEAINELSGPTNEAIQLVNEIRTRAGLDNVPASVAASKEAFRDHILTERGWEFYMEGLRRDDLIRHGKYISSAQARGLSLAKDYHVIYPIPLGAYHENSNINQNPGYTF
jgi:hypothetical protein